MQLVNSIYYLVLVTAVSINECGYCNRLSNCVSYVRYLLFVTMVIRWVNTDGGLLGRCYSMM